MVLIVNEKHRYLIEEQFGSIIEFKKKVWQTCYFDKQLIKAFMAVLEVWVEKAAEYVLEI